MSLLSMAFLEMRTTCRSTIIFSTRFSAPASIKVNPSSWRILALFQEKLWALWHNDSHVIADDKLNWKKKCPTFNKVLKKMTEYFKMDIKATRFNWYRNSSEWKPFHHDAAAVKVKKLKSIYNFLINARLANSIFNSNLRQIDLSESGSTLQLLFIKAL